MINKFRYKKPQSQHVKKEPKDKICATEKNGVCKDKREEITRNEQNGVLDKDSKSKLKVSVVYFLCRIIIFATHKLLKVIAELVKRAPFN